MLKGITNVKGTNHGEPASKHIRIEKAKTSEELAKRTQENISKLPVKEQGKIDGVEFMMANPNLYPGKLSH